MNDDVAAVIESLTSTPHPELMRRMSELHDAAVEAGLSPSEIEAILEARSDVPRPLLPEERATLLAVLNHAPFPGQSELIAQVDAAMVVGFCGCGCATVTLAVNPSVPAASHPIPPLAEASVIGLPGDSVGGVLVLTMAGYLALLEVWAIDICISPFPSPESLDFHGA